MPRIYDPQPNFGLSPSVVERIQKLEVENERLRSELEARAWEISPAMAQAKIDQGNAENERLREAVKLLFADLETYASDFEQCDPEEYAKAKSTHVALEAGRKVLHT
jgi:class 3 adenylate cyclase